MGNAKIGCDCRIVTKTSNFREVVLGSCTIVDKTLFIQEVLDRAGSNILVTRPRRYGKTMNLSMFKTFIALEVDHEGNAVKAEHNSNNILFTGGGNFTPLKISKSKYMHEQGQYPVIKLDCKTISKDPSPTIMAHEIRIQLMDIANEYKLKFQYSEFKNYDVLINHKKEEINSKNLLINEITEEIRNINQQINQNILSTKQPTEDNRSLLKEDRAALERQQTALERQQAALERQQAALERQQAALERQQTALEKRFRNIQTASQCLKEMVNILCSTLHKKFGKQVYVLIDEYDAPINYSYSGENYIPITKRETNKQKIERNRFQSMTALMREIFMTLLKDNDHVKQGILTGILRIAKATMFSGLNNVLECGVLDDVFAACYGFTETEVEDLIKHKYLEYKIEEIKEWYNGYQIGGIDLYNPWSIVNYFNEGKIDAYWTDSGSNKLLEHIMDIDSVQPTLDTLYKDGKVVLPLDKRLNIETGTLTSSAIWSLLMHSGYITLSGSNHTSGFLVKISNEEVRCIFKKLREQWSCSEVKRCGVSDKLLKQMYDALDNYQLFAEVLQQRFMVNMKRSKRSEASFQSLIGGGIQVYHITNNSCEHKYELFTEFSLPGGRIDHMFYPYQNNLPVIIHEYKKLDKTNQYNIPTTLNYALHQMIVNKYFNAPLSKKEHHDEMNGWTEIKMRAFVFARDEVKEQWSVYSKEVSVDISHKPDNKTLYEYVEEQFKNSLEQLGNIKKVPLNKQPDKKIKKPRGKEFVADIVSEKNNHQYNLRSRKTGGNLFI